MKTIFDKIGKWFGYSLSLLKGAVERFPLTMGVTAITVMVFIIMTHASSPDDYQKISMVMILGMPITGFLKLIHERLGKVPVWMRALITLILLGIYYLMLPEDITGIIWGRYFGLLTVLYALFFGFMYFPSQEGFTRFLVERIGKFFLTGLYGMILFIGFNGIFFSIEGLFEVNFPSELPLDIFYCIAGFFGVPYFLGSLQKKPEELVFSKIFRTLLLYIMIPIESIYTVILYAYFVRVLMMGTLPEGLIGNLVLWYAIISFITLYLVQTLREELPWLNRYTQIFSALMTVPMAMLIVAMWIRISNYGLTAARYYSLLAIVFLIVGYVLLPFKRRDFSMVHYVVGVCLVAISCFGIFSWDRVILWEQTNRLESQLIEAGYTFENGKILPAAAVSDASKDAISNSMNYLLRTYEPSDIDLLPADFDASDSEKTFGFELNDRYNYKHYNYVDEQFRDANEMIDVSEADYVVLLNQYDRIDDVLYDEQVQVVKSEAEENLRITEGGSLIEEIDMAQLATKALESKENKTTVKVPLSSGETLTITIDFSVVGGRKTSNGTLDGIQYYNGYLLIGKDK